MNYETGSILKFNQSRWGLISYSKNTLTALNLENNTKTYFSKLDKATFEKIYATREPQLSQETLDFIADEAKKLEELLNSLNPGAKFIGNDGGEYTLLSKNNSKITFYNSDDTYTATIKFVKSVTGEFNKDYLTHLNPVKTMKEYNALTNEERVQIAINEAKRTFDDMNFEVIEIGNIVKGIAYYHEVDDFYPLIGLQVKYKYKFVSKYDKLNDAKESIGIGFFPIYIGKVKDYYPFSFPECYSQEELFDEYRYDNGYGDKIDIEKVLVNKDKLKEIPFK